VSSRFVVASGRLTSSGLHPQPIVSLQSQRSIIPICRQSEYLLTLCNELSVFRSGVRGPRLPRSSASLTPPCTPSRSLR
jgi:hypothetical protein